MSDAKIKVIKLLEEINKRLKTIEEDKKKIEKNSNYLYCTRRDVDDIKHKLK